MHPRDTALVTSAWKEKEETRARLPRAASFYGEAVFKKKKKREKTRIQPTSADQRKFPHTFNKRPKRPFMSNEKFPQHVLLITRNENRMKRRNSQFRIFFGHGSECKHEAPVGTQKGTVSNRWHGATSCRFSTQMRQGRSIHFTTARLKRKFF